MIDPNHPSPRAAALVEPSSIELRSRCREGAELLVRSRPPGAVHLDGGQREHMLMCSFGRSVAGTESRSVLRTEEGVRQWRRPPTGHVTFIPAGMPMDWEWSYHSSSVHLILDPAYFDELRNEVLGTQPEGTSLRPVLRITSEPLRHLLHQLRDECAAEHTGRELALSSLTHLAALQVLRTISGHVLASEERATQLSNQELRRALDMIEDRLEDSLSLAELATECGLSVHHFARAFKRSVGAPPHEYQLQRRIQRAKELLEGSPKRRVADIASQLGFADESHLRRHFKRIVGTTPGRYRR